MTIHSCQDFVLPSYPGADAHGEEGNAEEKEEKIDGLEYHRFVAEK